MSSIKMLINKFSNSDDTIDLLPAILIIVLVSCILFCILWMIFSLVKKRSMQRQLNNQREAAATAFFSSDNLRVIGNVYTPTGESLGKLTSYQPIMYSVKGDPTDLAHKTIKVIYFY